jgi:hypothetical protein
MSEQLVNAQDTYQASSTVREDIHDVISMIDPSETPLFSLLNRGSRKVSSTKHEWTIDELSAPDPDNARVQGYRYTFDPSDTPAKVGNYTQIFDRSYLIAETLEAVDKVGRRSEVARQKTKKGMEIRIDIELALNKNQASVAGSGTVPARMAGMPAWIETNRSMGTGGSAGGYNAATGIVDAATAGTKRAWARGLLDDVLQSAYQNGGKPDVLIGSPYAKRQFSTLIGAEGIATLQTLTRGSEAATAIGAVDAYRSDFGLINFVPNVQLPNFGADYASNMLVVDKNQARMGWLRRIQEDKDIQKSGDAVPGVLKCEATLIVDNEAAHGVVADIYGMNASN